MKQTLKPG